MSDNESRPGRAAQSPASEGAVMTPGPDATAALAAVEEAVHTVHRPTKVRVICERCRPEAEAIIAALAADGWRITSAPEVASGPASYRDPTGDSADTVVSAQAAPDTGTAEWWQAEYERREQAAVRAALEGLRAEMVDLTTFGDPAGGPRLHRRAIAAIDARLAALDA